MSLLIRKIFPDTARQALADLYISYQDTLPEDLKIRKELMKIMKDTIVAAADYLLAYSADLEPVNWVLLRAYPDLFPKPDNIYFNTETIPDYFVQRLKETGRVMTPSQFYQY